MYEWKGYIPFDELPQALNPEDGLIVTDANQFKFGNNHVLQNTNILLVRKFLRDLTESGVDVPGGV